MAEIFQLDNEFIERLTKFFTSKNDMVDYKEMFKIIENIEEEKNEIELAQINQNNTHYNTYSSQSPKRTYNYEPNSKYSQFSTSLNKESIPFSYYGTKNYYY